MQRGGKLRGSTEGVNASPPGGARRQPPVRAVALALALALSPAAARAQTAPALFGFTPDSRAVAVVERTPTPAGFVHVTLVEWPADGSPPRRIRMTTDDEAALHGSAAGATREAIRATAAARVDRDLAAAADRYVSGERVSVAPVGPTPTRCARAPFAGRSWLVGGDLVARFTVAPQGTSARLDLVQRGVSGRGLDLPTVTLAGPATGTVVAPYDTVAEAREVPGEDAVALLLGTDACMPGGAQAPPRVVVLPLPAPVGSALAPLAHAELADRDVVRVVAPRARRRAVDGAEGWYDDRAQWVVDNAWSLGDERFLVQVTARERDLSPVLAEQGQSPTSFALLARRGGRLALVARVEPRGADGPLEGTGQEAFGADLDGDGATDVIVRARYAPAGETTTVLRATPDALAWAWTEVTQFDERRDPVATGGRVFPRSRRCALGLDGRALVVRCHETEYGATGDPGRRRRTSRRLVLSESMVRVEP